MRLGTHAKIGICWSILVGAGIYSFYLSKKSVIERRYEEMKRKEQVAAVHDIEKKLF